MATELKLGSIKLGSDTWSIGMSSIQGGKSFASVTVAADHAKNQSLDNYGTLYLDAEGVLTLKGGSDLTGDVTITENADTSVSLSAVSFGAAVSVALDGKDHQSLKTVVGSTSADSISVSNYNDTDFVLSAGAGNDTVVASIVAGKVDAGAGNDLVSVTGAVNEVVLGAGKDTLEFGGAATVAVSDYNFSDDVIVLGAATLGDNGNLYNSDSVVSGLTAANGVFLARTTDGSNTTILATAEEDAGKVVITDTVSKNENVIIIDADSADSANITLGKASLASVALKAGNDAVDTIKIGDTKATVNAVVTGFSTDDVLNFTGLTFKNSTIGATTGGEATLSSGKVNVTLGTGATVTGGVAFNLNGTKLYATSSTSELLDLKDEADLSKILIKGNNDVSVKSGIKTSAKLVNLDADNIYNIDYVELTADTAAKASVIGTKNDKAGITIDASKATDGVAVWANNSSTKDGVKDMISLSSAEAVDTLWFGSADGKDSVSGFQLESDVLYLYDSTTMTAKDGVLKIGKAEMSVKATATEEIMQVQGAKFAGTVYAAGDFNGSNTDIALGENAGKVNYYAVDKNASIVLSDKMTDSYTFLKDIDYAGASKANIAAGGSVASINASAITDTDAKVIIEGVANVSLGAGTNEVWVNGADNNATVVASASGSDKIWFSASDKNVTVSGFDTESDVIALMGTIGEFTAKMDSTNAVISNASKGKLTLDKTSDINLVDANGAKYKLYVDTADYTTNTDGTNIYLGAQLNASSEVTAATNIVVEGANNKWGIASSAIVGKDVKTIDMSSSSADFVLIGSANASNTITGGMGTNYLNGGGASKDVLNGNTGVVDFFYYGKEDGNDTLMNVGAEDTVVLYDIASTDLTATPKVTDEKTVITLNNDDSKLTIMGGIDGVTFQLTDGAYKYDSSADEKWVKQNV